MEKSMELAKREEQQLATVNAALQQQAQAMMAMADMVRGLRADVARLTEQLRRQELRLPVDTRQERSIQEAIRQRAESLAQANGWTDRRRINALGRLIRRSVLDGVGRSCGMSLRAVGDVPAVQYSVTMERISRWRDLAAMLKMEEDDDAEKL